MYVYMRIYAATDLQQQRPADAVGAAKHKKRLQMRKIHAAILPMPKKQVNFFRLSVEWSEVPE